VRKKLLVNKKIMKNFKKGFTLIELLVVVAIIGILASVVLASLNSARAKGSDAAIKAALSGARAQAELFYDTGQTYAGVCTTATTGIGAMILNAAQKLATTNTVTNAAWADSDAGAINSAVCHDSSSGWAAMVSLKATGATGWCVDSTGASKESTALGAADITCD
jgi:prepilin-type N-terminal cleavage/methylation domain-containing protein